MTERQFADGSKDVTRRVGWKSLKKGTLLRGVRKAMGLKKGEKIQSLGVLQVVSVRSERLDAITKEECIREGFPEMTPAEFIDFFAASHKCNPETVITRIEFKRLDFSVGLTSSKSSRKNRILEFVKKYEFMGAAADAGREKVCVYFAKAETMSEWLLRYLESERKFFDEEKKGFEILCGEVAARAGAAAEGC